MNRIIENTCNFVQNLMKDNDVSHNWDHIQRVVENAKTIWIKTKQGDKTVILLAAILHDVMDYKYSGSTEASAQVSSTFLLSQGIKERTVDHVISIINSMGFKDEIEGERKLSIEGKIVQDADRLDAMGSMGIVRCLIYANKKGNPIHDPTVRPKIDMTKDEYMDTSRRDTAINHFYEKLFKLKDMMKTQAGRDMAEERHKIMYDFVKSYEDEYDSNHRLSSDQKTVKFYMDTYLKYETHFFDPNMVKVESISSKEHVWGCQVESPNHTVTYDFDGVEFYQNTSDRYIEGDYDTVIVTRFKYQGKDMLKK